MPHEQYAAAGFLSDLLPIMPATALPPPKNNGDAEPLKGRGKMPGIKVDNGAWVPMKHWHRHVTTRQDVTKWDRWGAGVGIRGGRVCGLDIDVDDEDTALAITKLALDLLGSAPIRIGRPPRALLPYTCPDLKKRALTFRSPKTGVTHKLEWLGAGQQFVVEGVHPGTNKPYTWKDSRSLADVGMNGLCTITEARAYSFLDAARSLVQELGFEPCDRAPQAVREQAAEPERAQSSRRGPFAPSLRILKQVIESLPLTVDYDTWFSIVSAARGSAADTDQDAVRDIVDAWSAGYLGAKPGEVRSRWPGVHGTSWHRLLQLAKEHGGFVPSPKAIARSKIPDSIFERYVWVERVKRLYDLESGDLLDQEQFDVNHSEIEFNDRPAAWLLVTSDTDRLKKLKRLTYRPGAGRFVEENLPGLTGECVNTWRFHDISATAPVPNESVTPWLGHMEYLFPDERERGIILDWMAWCAQNPGKKPNWALVWGGRQGIGKDLALEPLRAAFGAENVRELNPAELIASTYWAKRCKLGVVEEMQSSERKETMNRLKPLVAAPPYTITINEKFVPQYALPNLIAFVFLTNMSNALHLEGDDRRFFVSWSFATPKLDESYRELRAWFDDGGASLAGQWLLQRDVTHFNALGRAPASAAKDQMRRASRPLLTEWVEDEIESYQGPFARDIADFREIEHAARAHMGRGPVSRAQLTAALKGANCRSTGQVRIQGEKRTTLYVVRNVSAYADMSDTAIRDVYKTYPMEEPVF